MIINNYIRDVMFEQDKTITYISKKTGYSIDRILDIITCKRPVSIKEADNILDALGVSLKDILGMY